MIIDCDRCVVRGDACRDCVVAVLLGLPGEPPSAREVPSGAPRVQLDAREYRALSVLAEQGLVPRLRLVAGERQRPSPGAGGGAGMSDTG